MVVYISGKMKNNDDYFMQFTQAEHNIKDLYPNATIINPAKFDMMISGKERLKYKDYLLADLHLVSLSDAIYILDNWENSDGAKTEYYFAIAIGLKILYQSQVDSV